MNGKFKSPRVPTGVKGLDGLIQGGFVQSSAVMLAGRAGTGKTLFGSQFLYNGAKTHGEVGLYVTLEQSPSDIKKDVLETFGWDFESLEKAGLINFLEITMRTMFDPTSKKRVMTTTLFEITQKILEAIKKFKVKRVVIDPITAIEVMFSEEPKYVVRSELALLSDRLREAGVTTLLVAETAADYMEGARRSEYVGFIVDAIVFLDFIPVAEEFKRTLSVVKMRRTNHSGYIHPFFIRPAGIEVVEKIEDL